jgi:hypothetical protein
VNETAPTIGTAQSSTVPKIGIPTTSPLLVRDIDPLFWPSLRADSPSGWHGHVSFGHWIVQAIEPNIVVELGTYNGVSFASFCQSVVRRGLQTKCFAVDTWRGDEHAGHYTDDVFDELLRFKNENFGDFVVFMRCLFDDALTNFADGSVDLLHIDGLHTFDAISHDFATWLPKLSDRAVVLFHDTEARIRDFGVWKLWESLSSQYPSFSFLHSNGLGVLAVGRHPPLPVALLCAANRDPEATVIRQRFSVASDIAYRIGHTNLRHDADLRIKKIINGRRNIALNCPAFQSSAFLNSGPTPQGAVNGIKTGLYGFHTESEAYPWWMVDLGEQQMFDNVIIYNRLDDPCALRSRLLTLLTSADGETWTELYRHDGSVFGGFDGYPLDIRCAQIQARFVRVRLRETNALHLDEVEIYSGG